MAEQESSEEAVSARDLVSQIDKFFNDSNVEFKDGSEIDFGDRIYVEEQLTQYNDAMILPLNKKYACITKS